MVPFVHDLARKRTRREIGKKAERERKRKRERERKRARAREERKKERESFILQLRGPQVR